MVRLAWTGIPDYSFQISRFNLEQSLDLISFIAELGSCRKILVAGSCWEFNRLKGRCSEKEIGTPKNNFTWAKHTLRSWLEIECLRKEIILGWMRLFYVYGPRQRAESLIPSILYALKEGKPPHILFPEHANDFIFVEDVANALSQAVNQDFSSGIYNLGSGSATPILKVFRVAENIVLGSEDHFKKLEERTKPKQHPVDFWADLHRSKNELSWIPSTSLEEGISQTWEWIQRN